MTCQLSQTLCEWKKRARHNFGIVDKRLCFVIRPLMWGWGGFNTMKG
jgi:hypothetical protein